VQSPQVVEAQLLNRFSTTPGEVSDHLGAAASSRGRIAVSWRHLD